MRHRNSLMSLLLVTTLINSMFVPVIPPTAGAAASDGTLRIDVITAYNLVVDSNVESPSTYAPRAATFGALVCNDGTTELTNVTVAIGDYVDGGSSTPGIYPSRTVTETTYGGTFALTHEGGSRGTSDATRFLPVLDAESCVTQYWLVSYPRLDALGRSVTGDIKVFDDLWLEYDIWAGADNVAAGTAQRADVTTRVTMRNEISAAANKILPNGDNKVPQVYLDAIADVLGWDTFAPDGSSLAYPGETIITKGIWYDLGVIGQGFDNDGNLIPDYNAWLQPVGDPALQNPGCFQLIRPFGIIVIKLIDGGEYLIPFVNQLYFENAPPNNGAVGLVYYEYLATNSPCNASLTPYQEVASGYDNEKFSGDYGTGIPALNSQPTSVELSKSVDQAALTLPGELRYTISFTNSGTTALGAPSAGVPLLVQDSIPVGTTYITGSATLANVLPSAVDRYLVQYSHDNGVTWGSSEGTASTVTDIRWWLSDSLNPAALGSVGFSVAVAAGYDGSLVSNSAGLGVSTAEPFVTATIDTPIGGANSVSGSVFADDGSAALFGNGTFDTPDESLLPNITVTLHRDVDGDGMVDATDPLVATTAAASSGAFSFSGLVDGNYLVQVERSDSDLPIGWAETTATLRTADLDSSRVNGSAVDLTDRDFGFAPALSIVKRLIGDDPVYEGDLVSFVIDVRNRLPASSSTGEFCRYEVPATLINNSTTVPASGASTNAQWTPSSAALGRPDNLRAITGLTNNDDIIGLSGFTATGGGSITSVDLQLHVREEAALRSSDKLIVKLYNRDAVVSSGWLTYTGATAPFTDPTGVAQIIHWPLTSLRSWSWADFITTTTELQLTGARGTGAGDPGDVGLDAAVFIVTTDELCSEDPRTLSSVPLIDTYDHVRLGYQYASRPPSSDDGSGTLRWSNIGPILPGQTKTLTVTFAALAPLASGDLVTNTATISNVRFADGTVAGSAADDASVGVLYSGRITGTVFHDTDADGWIGSSGYEAGVDAGLALVTVELYACVNTVSGALITAAGGLRCDQISNAAWTRIASTQTSSSGDYAFENLRNGYYVVEIADGSPILTTSLTSTLPTTAVAGAEANTDQSAGGFSCPAVETCDGVWGDPLTAALTTAAFNPIDTENEAILDVNFGFTFTTTRLFGQVWHDSDADTVIDSAEQDLSGVTVLLCADSVTPPCTAAAALLTTTTDSLGGYWFDVANGSYIISSDPTTLPGTTDWSLTADFGSGPLDDTSDPITVDGSTSLLSYDFGYRTSGTLQIGDTLYYDWNGDADQDAATDEGIIDVTVQLYRDDGDGVLEFDQDALISSTVTDSSGGYLFGGLAAGAYLVRLDATDSDFPLDARQTEDYESGNGIVCSNCDNRAAVTLTASDVTTADFGYRPLGFLSIGDLIWSDRDGNQTQGGVEAGLPAVSATLQVDWNRDGTFVSIATAYSDLEGAYRFDYLATGDYRVIVNTVDDDVPLDGLGVQFTATTPISYDVTLSATDVVTVDFGFAPLGAIGDTIFWDGNRDGEQDWTESGIDGVTVTLYSDSNANATFDDGIDTVYSTTVSVAGKYLFSGLPAGGYLVVVAPISGDPALSADPDTDGVPCLSGPTGCDSMTHVRIYAGTAAMGADFGYMPVGTIGDSVWLDSDNDGTRDPTEPGLADITVTLSDGLCTISVDCPSVVTDIDGYYQFTNIADGSYTVIVDSADSDLPAGSSLTSESDALLNGITAVVLNGGNVTNVGGTGCTDCELDVDFGFRFAGSFDLSGTVCLDDPTLNGVCGSGSSGVSADERAFPRQSVTLLRWTDDGDGTVESGETRIVGSTSTDSLGDYQFVDLAAGSYIMALIAPQDALTLTTTAADTPADSVTATPASGTTRSAAQSVTVAASQVGLDFAFVSSVDYDFGDLPAPYVTTSSDAPLGPSHIITATPSLYLGTTAPDSELDGTASLAADADGADEDGITALDPTAWIDGAGGGTISVTVTGGGYLIGWMDFNTDGDFTDSAEMVINQPVISGTVAYSVTVPTGTFSSGSADVPSRFRLFTSQPAVPLLSYAAPTSGGEIEDYVFALGTSTVGYIAGTVYDDVDEDGTFNALIDTPLSGVTVIITDWEMVTYTLVTDADGAYRQLVPIGGVLIDVDDTTLPDGAVLTIGDEDPTETLVTADETTTVDVGYIFAEPIPADIGGIVWVDLDGDCLIDDGETLVANLTITLTLSGDDGLFGTADDTISTTVTSGSGAYIFADQLPAGFRVSLDLMDSDLGTRMVSCESDGSPNGVTDGVVGDGVNQPAVNFALRPAAVGTHAAIGNLIWRDSDSDGVKDLGESGLAGVELQLSYAGLDDIFGNSDDSLITTTSGVDGSYSFPGLAAGQYRVTVLTTTLPAGLYAGYDRDGSFDDSARVSLLNGEQQLDVDFAYTPAAAVSDDAEITGIVWLDWNDDGVQSPDEPGLPAVELLIDDGVNPPYTVTTDDSGSYTLTQLVSGTYQISVIDPSAPPGSDPASDPDDGRDGTADLVVTDNASVVADFALIGSGLIGDRIWQDLDADRLQDSSEAGVDAIDVTLRWAGRDGVFATADDAVRTMSTGAATPPVAATLIDGTLSGGYYWFANLLSGKYRVTIDTAQLGAVSLTTQTFERDGSTDAVVDAALAPAEQLLDVDFGFTTSAAAAGDNTLSGTVWLDADGDALFDASEFGLPGVDLILIAAGSDTTFDTADDVHYTTATAAADGSYRFDGLPDGSYRVMLDSATLPAGLSQTFEFDSSLNEQLEQSLTGGMSATDRDFGYQGTADLSGTFWLDDDEDGTIDVAESPLPTVTVAVRWFGPDALPAGGDDVVVMIADTDSSGDYGVSHLPAGTYQVTYEPAAVSELLPTHEADAPLPVDVQDGRTQTALTPRSLTRSLNFGFSSRPTAIELSQFSARRTSAQSMTIDWSTVSEIESFAFTLSRSTTGRFIDAVPVTAQPIRATGAGSSYRFVDKTAVAGPRYFYWLIEIETTGRTRRYGPVSSAAPSGLQRFDLFVPLITR